MRDFPSPLERWVVRSFRVILVAVRELGGRRSVVIERAAQIAAGCGARLELFHDLATPVYVDTLSGSGKPLAALTRATRTTVVQRLERLAEPLRARGLKVTTAAVWDFPTYEAIVRRAMAIHADLIVTRKHGHHRWPALLGYTDWELLRSSPVPVLLIKNPRYRPRSPVLAAIDPRLATARPAPLEVAILRNAAAVAAALRAPLHAVHVLAPWASALADRRPLLVRHTKAVGIKASRLHVLDGDPDLLLPATARRLRAGITVMGAMSRRGLKRLFVGNSAERLLDDLQCDVLVIKPPHFPARMPRARRGVFFLSNVPMP